MQGSYSVASNITNTKRIIKIAVTIIFLCTFSTLTEKVLKSDIVQLHLTWIIFTTANKVQICWYYCIIVHAISYNCKMMLIPQWSNYVPVL